MSANTYVLNVGDIKCAIFNDGYLQDAAGRFGLNCLCIQTGGRQILIDTGCGANFKGPPGQTEEASGTAGHLLESMREEGFRPGGITDIIFSHAHIDHVCGAFDKDGQAVFSNARYIIHQKEWDYFKSGPGKIASQQWLFADARKYLTAFKDRFVMVEDNYVPVPGVKILPAPGHTPGSIMVEITSKSTKLLCIGDIIHAHIEFEEMDHFAFLDVDPKQAVKTRREVITGAAKDQTFIFATHFTYPGLGYFRERNGVLGWTPI
jgi:glyoxylase-like metal-dependent hydrolase (beta-lactamase superfamily II)